jgi:hypothetical protein
MSFIYFAIKGAFSIIRTCRRTFLPSQERAIMIEHMRKINKNTNLENLDDSNIIIIEVFFLKIYIN